MKRAMQFALGFLLALALQGVAGAQTATVMTDKSDYAPGTIVTITGSGWQPGENVTLNLLESPLVDNHPDLYATADDNGNIFNNQFSPDVHDISISFTLTATAGGGFSFVGWSGVGNPGMSITCTGTSTCSASANGNQDFAVTATFQITPTIRRKGQTIIANLLNKERYGVLTLQRSTL